MSCGVTSISTRRFSARPSWLSLAARGMTEPMPRRDRRSRCKPLRRKIAAIDCARSWLSFWLAALAPLESAWPRINTAVLGSVSMTLATRVIGPRVIGNSMDGRSGLKELSTGAVTISTLSRRSSSNLLSLSASRKRGS
ncbi:hypothetical protein D3C80_1104380 [compost metagenome]